MKFGYARVSTIGQDLETQVSKLIEAGCDSENIYKEKETGASTEHRKALAQLKRTVRKGDTVIVAKIDRLGRSIIDLNKIVSELVEKGVSVEFLDDSITFSGKDDAMTKLIFNMMGSFAEFERSIIVQRTSEGRERAKRSGVKFGRKIPKSRRIALDRALEMYDQRAEKNYTLDYITSETGIGKSSLYNELRKRKSAGLK